MVMLSASESNAARTPCAAACTWAESAATAQAKSEPAAADVTHGATRSSEIALAPCTTKATGHAAVLA